jgi:hypothetical protein
MDNAFVKEKLFQAIAGIFPPSISLQSFNSSRILCNKKGIEGNKRREQIRLVD